MKEPKKVIRENENFKIFIKYLNSNRDKVKEMIKKEYLK